MRQDHYPRNPSTSFVPFVSVQSGTMCPSSAYSQTRFLSCDGAWGRVTEACKRQGQSLTCFPRAQYWAGRVGFPCHRICGTRTPCGQWHPCPLPRLCVPENQDCVRKKRFACTRSLQDQNAAVLARWAALEEHAPHCHQSAARTSRDRGVGKILRDKDLTFFGEKSC